MANKFTDVDFAAEVQKKSIDFFITSASFEDRCFVVSKRIKDLAKRFVIFYNENEVVKIIENAKEIGQFLGSEANLIALNSDLPIENYQKIDSLIRQWENIRPNILVDSTTFTHETLLVLLRLLSLRKGQMGKVYFSYVGASQYSSNSENDEDRWLSKGVREIRSVIGYPGYTDPTCKNHLMIMVGFESERTKRIIQEYEYDFVSLGFGDVEESIKSNHYKINYERHKKLMEEFPGSEMFTFCLTDPVKTKGQIISYLDKAKYRNLNTVVAPLNNKISTIGAGLAAIEKEDIQIAYAKPNIYNTVAYSVASNEIYFGELTL